MEMIEKLKVAANQFYLNKYSDKPKLSDQEYDELVKEFESRGGSVKDLIEWDKKSKVPSDINVSLSKLVVKNNDLKSAIEKYIKDNNIKGYYLNYKYDGCAVMAHYKNGRLTRIVSTPDESFCIIRTKQLWDLFPHKIEDKSIIAIQGEALVDASKYGERSRNKANGLVNSEDMQQEINKELFVIAYRVYFDGDDKFNYWKNYKALSKLPTKVSSKRLIFGTATKFNIENTPDGPIIDSDPIKIQCDGVVLYSDKGVKGFKFYFTDSETTEVIFNSWVRQLNGGWMPKLIFNPIKLNNKNITQCASGGVKNLISKGLGVGSEVVVILSGMTIPKVIKVNKKSSNIKFPKCECGYQTSESDIVGSTVKCMNPDCSRKYSERWARVLKSFNRSEVNDPMEYLRSNLYKTIDQGLMIDRWAAKKQIKKGKSESELINDLIGSLDTERFIEVIHESFKFTSLNYKMLKSEYKILNNIIKNLINIRQ